MLTLLIAFDSHEMLLSHLSDFSQIRTNGISLKWSYHIPTKSRDPLHIFFPSFSPSIRSSHYSQSTFTFFLLISFKPKVCHVYKFTSTSLAGPPSYPLVFINGDDVSILLLLFCFSYFKIGNSPMLLFTVKLGRYLRFYFLHIQDSTASCYTTW